MPFSNLAQRAAYFENLKQKGLLQPKANGLAPIGLAPAQHNNMQAMLPMSNPAMPPKSVMPNMNIPAMSGNIAPNSTNPLNMGGKDKFGKLKKFF